MADNNSSSVKKVQANPINIAYILSQKSDTAKIISTLVYYGYIPQSPSSEGKGTLFIHPNGSQIRYEFKDGDKYPTVEVRTKASAKEKAQILNDLNFKKTGNAYERKSPGSTVRCTSGSHNFLTFNTRISSQT